MLRASSEGPSGPSSLVHKLPLCLRCSFMGRGPLQTPGAAGGEGLIPAPGPPTHPTSLSPHRGPALDLKASLQVSGRGAAVQPWGYHPFYIRAMPSGPTQPLPPRSPRALILAKQAWVTSSVFHKILPIFVFQTPSLQGIPLSHIRPFFSAPAFLKHHPGKELPCHPFLSLATSSLASSQGHRLPCV